LLNIDGVTSAVTNTTEHTATVVFDDTKTNTAEMETVLTNNGYPVESMKYETIPPVADAGYSRQVHEGETVTLDASGSYDEDDGIAEYLWEQTGGTSVTLSDRAGVRSSFVAPKVGPDGEMLTFRVSVTDNAALYSQDYVTVQVTGEYEGGTRISGTELWLRAVIHTPEKGQINAIWHRGGEDATADGHKVIWGYFHASPADVNWGSRDNPDIFVKIWFDAGGRIDVNYFHVSVPDTEVFSDYLEDDHAASGNILTMDRRYVRHYYENSGSYSEEGYEDGNPPEGYETEGHSAAGYLAGTNLGISAVIHTADGDMPEAVWKQGGGDVTEAGHEVVWGYFYANPSDVSWGSPENPDLFVKIWFDAGGRVDVNFFHVSVPDIAVYSDFPRDGVFDRKGKTILKNRYIRHEYQH